MKHSGENWDINTGYGLISMEVIEPASKKKSKKKKKHKINKVPFGFSRELMNENKSRPS